MSTLITRLRELCLVSLVLLIRYLSFALLLASFLSLPSYFFFLNSHFAPCCVSLNSIPAANATAIARHNAACRGHAHTRSPFSLFPVYATRRATKRLASSGSRSRPLWPSLCSLLAFKSRASARYAAVMVMQAVGQAKHQNERPSKTPVFSHGQGHCQAKLFKKPASPIGMHLSTIYPHSKPNKI